MKSVVFPVLCVCACLIVPVSASAQKSRTCAPSAIRAAAAKQVTPNLVGCRYDEVAVPLVRYFSIFPVLTKTPGREATSTILEQRPAAGEPLAAGGQLALNVSVGRSASPEQNNEVPVETGSTAAPEANSAPATVVATSALEASEAPVEIMEFAVTSDAPAKSSDVSSRALKLPSLDYLLRPGLLWAWSGIIIVAGAGIAWTFRGKRRRSEYGYDRVPKVTARLEYGPGRLSVHGALIIGRESGQ